MLIKYKNNVNYEILSPSDNYYDDIVQHDVVWNSKEVIIEVNNIIDEVVKDKKKCQIWKISQHDGNGCVYDQLKKYGDYISYIEMKCDSHSCSHIKIDLTEDFNFCKVAFWVAKKRGIRISFDSFWGPKALYFGVLRSAKSIYIIFKQVLLLFKRLFSRKRIKKVIKKNKYGVIYHGYCLRTLEAAKNTVNRMKKYYNVEDISVITIDGKQLDRKFHEELGYDVQVFELNEWVNPFHYLLSCIEYYYYRQKIIKKIRKNKNIKANNYSKYIVELMEGYFNNTIFDAYYWNSIMHVFFKYNFFDLIEGVCDPNWIIDRVLKNNCYKAQMVRWEIFRFGDDISKGEYNDLLDYVVLEPNDLQGAANYKISGVKSDKIFFRPYYDSFLYEEWYKTKREEIDVNGEIKILYAPSAWEKVYGLGYLIECVDDVVSAISKNKKIKLSIKFHPGFKEEEASFFKDKYKDIAFIDSNEKINKYIEDNKLIIADKGLVINDVMIARKPLLVYEKKQIEGLNTIRNYVNLCENFKQLKDKIDKLKDEKEATCWMESVVDKQDKFFKDMEQYSRLLPFV